MMKTILFVDDNRNIRAFCRRELEAEGYRVALAEQGAEAVRAVRKDMPDAIVLDLCMPVMGGLEAIEQIRAFAPSVPVILFTSHVEDSLGDRRSRLATACVEKSEDLTELKQALLRVSLLGHERDTLGLGLPSSTSALCSSLFYRVTNSFVSNLSRLRHLLPIPLILLKHCPPNCSLCSKLHAKIIQ
jgi:CheY-like chemotaxis protein